MPRAHYTFIPPDLEGTYCHFSLPLGKLYRGLLIGTTVSCLIGLLFGQRTLYAGVENYEKLNEVWNTTFIEGRKAKGYSGSITLKETIDSLNESHTLHELERRNLDWISYNFGSNIHNYCQRVPFLNGTTLPSLIRLLEFRADSQLFFRNAVLCAICIRMFLSVVCANYIWSLYDYSCLARLDTLFLPLLDLLWMSFAMLILCLQKDIDILMRSWMYWHLPIFGACFVAYAIFYVMFTAAVLPKTWRTIVQFVCICLFCASFPQVYISYLELLSPGGKPCYIDVPFFIAFAEYVAIASVYVFVCTQFWELTAFEGIITLCKMEYDDYFCHTADYTPAFSLEETFSAQASTRSSSDSTSS